MALKINNPTNIITSDDRIIRTPGAVWLKPYFPSNTTAQVELVFYENASEYVEEQLAQQPRGVIVASVNFPLNETDFYNTLHDKVKEYLLTLDPTLDIEQISFLGIERPEPEVIEPEVVEPEVVEPEPEPDENIETPNPDEVEEEF